MKRKLFLGAFTIAIVCVGAVGASNYSATSAENDLDMANVEALSRDDADTGCHDINGYTAFTNTKGGAYNCCTVWKKLQPKSEHCK